MDPLKPFHRYTPSRKAAIIFALRAKKITMDQAKKIHNLSDEELDDWFLSFDLGGRAALRITVLPGL